jgi:transposase InsO family protein
MFEYYNNILCVQSNWLIESGILKVSHYKQLIHREYLRLLRRGGNGRTALVEFRTMRPDIRDKVVELAGDPTVVAPRTSLQKHIQPDHAAAAHFATFRKLNGKPLTKEKQQEYTTNAMVLNAVNALIITAKGKSRIVSKTRLWENISNAVNSLPSNEFNHSLPGNYRSIERMYKRYKKDGYASLIHGQTDNDNRRKIAGPVADYLLATYCLPNKPAITTLIELYDTVRLANGWPMLSEEAVRLYLEQPEVKRLWMLARHGKNDYKNAFAHTLTRDRSEWFPNAYWAIDGTKLDWIHYFDSATGMAAKLKINPVFDVFSEMIIGYSISETENHVDHFTAIKAAVSFTGARPYKFTYDNQSGHKSKRMQEVYSGVIAREGGVHFATRPYEHSNPAEQLFNRLQQQVISTFWFSDKQSIKARLKDNQVNMEFIIANKHKLYDREGLIKAWELALKLWNEAKHPHFAMSRTEVFAQPAPFSESISFIDQMNLFWVSETKHITYNADGILVRIAGQVYQYEVYDADNRIDLEFRRFNIGKKFIVRYDPEQLDAYIQLIEVTAEGEHLFIANAQPKRKHQEIPVLMKDGDKALFLQDFEVRDLELERDEQELKALLARTGITPEKLIEDQDLMIKMGGYLPKDLRSDAESDSIFSLL